MIKGDQLKKIILASKSPRRQELLNQIGIPYEVVASKVDEKCVGDLPPDQLVDPLRIFPLLYLQLLHRELGRAHV